MIKVRKYVLARKLAGEIKSSDFEVQEEEIKPNLKNGGIMKLVYFSSRYLLFIEYISFSIISEIFVEAEYLSIDAGLRVYFNSLNIGDTLIGFQVAKILDSKNPKFPVGSHICGSLGWTTHSIFNPNEIKQPVKPYLLPNFGKLSSSLALGVLGLSGNTAYFGFNEILTPKKGEVVVVSTAAGGVGTHVVQLAQIAGCHVIGLTGSNEKVEWLKNELNIDAAINYKDKDWVKQLRNAAPNGIDCYFDNVGGDLSTRIISQMRLYGRIAVCGSTSVYNTDLKKLPTG